MAYVPLQRWPVSVNMRHLKGLYMVFREKALEQLKNPSLDWETMC